MPARRSYDAIVVGSGPNGLAAAIVLSRAGCSVLVLEARDTPGGGARSAEITLPGFVHDLCSAIHPFAVGAPFFPTLPLAEHGLTWIHPPAPLAHPFDDGTAAILERSIEATGLTLGPDAPAYCKLMRPLAESWHALARDLLGPLRVPHHPLRVARFGWYAIRSGRRLAEHLFAGQPARALFAGLAAHSILSLEQPLTAAFGLLLGAAGHAVGWPLPQGGAQRIANALTSYLRSRGGEVVTGSMVHSVDELPVARAVLLDLTPRQVLRISGHRLPEGFRRQLERYRYGAGAFKLDWALADPIPWTAPACRRAGTVHVGGTLAEIAGAEQAVARQQHPEKPFVLVAQPSLFDPTRAPAGKHTAWAYCHVPHGSVTDMTARIEAQIERFAPGFQQRILARTVTSPAALERYNANYVGGDINGGMQDFRQLFTRPTVRLVPYTTPIKGLYICSSSTPPGGGVHGMCGYFAAQAALRDLRRSEKQL